MAHPEQQPAAFDRSVKYSFETKIVFSSALQCEILTKKYIVHTFRAIFGNSKNNVFSGKSVT